MKSLNRVSRAFVNRFRNRVSLPTKLSPGLYNSRYPTHKVAMGDKAQHNLKAKNYGVSSGGLNAASA